MQARAATEAMRKLAEAMRPRTEAEYWQWLAVSDPVRYVFERRRSWQRARERVLSRRPSP